MLRFKFMA